MSIAYVTKQSLTPVICSPNSAEMAAGDLVRLALNTAVVPEFPVDIIGVVQPPVRRVAMLDPIGGCRVVGYEYDISFTVEDLLGAAVDLTADLILSMGCVTCCQILDERLLAERAERIAFDDGVRTLTLTAPPLQGSTGVRVTGTITPSGDADYLIIGDLNGKDHFKQGIYQFRWTGTQWNFEPDSLLTVYFYSLEDVDRPDQVQEWLVGTGAGPFAVLPITGTVALALGQPAIYTSGSGAKYTFRNTNLSPMTWEGATPFLTYNPDIPRWSIGRLSGPDGGESLTFDALV